MEKRLSVILNKNGSIDIVPEDVPTSSQDWIPGTFLLLGFCFETGLGLISLLGLRIKTCPRAIIGLQLATLLDCIQGQVLGAVFLVVKPTDCLCRISASTSTTFLVIQTAEIMLLTFPLQSLLSGIIPWVIGLSIGIFVIFDHQTPVNFYPRRHGCSVVNGQHGWLSMLMIIILGTSWMGSAAGIIHGAVFREKNLDVLVSRIISFFYVILVLPMALILLITVSIKPNAGNSNDVSESVFTWARYQFNLLIPIIILLCYKQVRKESESILCWCRKNSIGQTNRAVTNNSLQIVSRRKIFNKYQKIKSDPRTPVLFATSNGLHLRTVNNHSTSNTTSLSCEPCDLTDHEISTSKMSLQPDVTVEPRKNVRFASPIGCDIPLGESGISSNTEFKFGVIQIQPENKPDDELGGTYTKK